jgi:tRNA-(ms[2]io[6]A)-hydroxylase
MIDLAREELQHFKMVLEKIKEKNLTFGKERRDEYVNDLMKFIRKNDGKEALLIDRLLVCAMIEARSCERFKLLSQKLKDKELANFYHQLMKSEARHYTLFIKLAKELVPSADIEKRWKDLINYEGEIMKKYGKKEEIHG